MPRKKKSIINDMFNHIKKHKLVYAVGVFALIVVIVMSSINSSGLKYSSKLAGNLNFAASEITEEEFGQIMDKTIHEKIQKIGEEKWERQMSDEERGEIIDSLFQKMIKKYRLEEAKEMRGSAKKMRGPEEEIRERDPRGHEERMREAGHPKNNEEKKNKERSSKGQVTASVTILPADDEPENDEEEKGHRVAKMDPKILEEENTLRGRRTPKVINTNDIKLAPPKPILTTLVEVSTNIKSGAYEIYNTKTNKLVASGGGISSTKFQLPASKKKPGIPYKITYKSVAGYTKPGDVNFSLYLGMNYSDTGKYTKIVSKTGTITVSTNNAKGSYKIKSIAGPKILSSGNGTTPKKHVLPAQSAPGTGYKIVFGSVKNYATPKDYFFNLATGDNFTYVGSYTIQTATKGTLSAMGMGSEADMFIITGGTKNYNASSYQFHAEKEAFTIKKLTIINDDDCIYGTSSNGFDKPKDTKAISQVNIAYKDKKGKKKTVIGGPLTNGSYTFNNLDFYIKKDGYNLLWVYADTYPITSGNFSISGSRFCIGLKDKNAKTEFEAVGESSGQSTQYKTTNKFAIDASRFIRKSKPVFSKVTQSSSAMPSSNGDIFKFNVKAEGGDVSFARLTFDIKTKGLNSAKDDIYNFELRNSSGAINDHHIWGRSLSFNAASVYLKDAKSGSGLQDADTAALGVDDETYKIVVTFDNEQTITVNQTETYTLRASIAGATTDDTIEVALAQVDETAKAIISSNYDNNNGANNTGHIIGNTNIKSDSLFSGSAGTGDDDNEFFNDTVNNWVNFRNIIWSDRSGGDVSSKGGAPTSSVHSYPTISGSSTSGAGTVVDYSGTIDWTNGEGLQVKKAGLYKFKK